jgi:hypothetical protein
MDSRHIRDLCEAYVAVYDDELRDELETSDSLDEDFSFVDDLSDNELTQVMESILLEGQYTLDECLDLIDYSILQEEAILSEAKPTPRQLEDRKKAREAREAQMRKSSAQAARGRTAYDVKQRLGRIGAAAGKAAENLASKARSGASRAKTYAGGVSSAVQGGAAEAGRKLTAAKEKIKGGLARIGRAAHRTATDVAAAPGIAKRAAGKVGTRLTHKAANLGAKAASGATSRLMNLAHRTYEKGGGESLRSSLKGGETSSAKAPWRGRYSGEGVGRREEVPTSRTSSTTSSSSGVRGALPPSKPRKSVTNPQRTGKHNTALRARLEMPARMQTKPVAKVDEYLEYILPYILEDFINEGHANDYDEAYEILETLNDYDFENLVESYIEENVEIEDYYDDIMNYLLDEGYAADEDSANVIMANMSEEWRKGILEKFISPYEGKPSYSNPQGLSPATRAMQKSDELQRTEPGSKRQKMQTGRSQQMNRMFQAARRA